MPERLYTASHDEIAAYLRSVFQADGYVSVRHSGGYESARVGVATISEPLERGRAAAAGHARDLLAAHPQAREARRPQRAVRGVARDRLRAGPLRRARRLRLATRSSASCCSSLSLRHPKHCGDLREEEIVSIEPAGTMDVYDIQTESGEFLTNNVAVHNCFILSVQDTMESILDWNTKEGMIFRGGSGSGINLSNIRGSMEPLAKGGTASGPVSFMRGADSWAGTIKSGRQDPPGGEDGGARRRPPRHPRVHLVQGQGGGQGRRAARRRLRHVDRRRRLQVDPVPERQQLGAPHRRVHARGREGRGLAPRPRAPPDSRSASRSRRAS